MRLPGYYSSGQFAKMAQVSIRTVRFYDKQNILKPSYLSDSGARFYTDADFAKLKQILLLKYLGFSLEDIRGMLVDDLDLEHLRNSLKLQKQLVLDRMEQMELVASAIDDTVSALEQGTQVQEIDWSQMLALIHLPGMEKSLKSQYQNASNITARIRLHRDYSTNQTGWFPWIYSLVEKHINNTREDSETDMFRILEIGCGNGALWTENLDKLPGKDKIHITLTDISSGMIRDVRRSIGGDKRFSYAALDCHKLPYEDESFDMVIANHVLFYCEDISAVCSEVRRVLRKPQPSCPTGGVFLCSAYGADHMHEITDLVQEFDNRIMLAAQNLYENFGLENGEEILRRNFHHITLFRYEDSILLDTAEPLIEYILSCHGNQNQYLLNRYHDFRAFVERKMSRQFHITKDAGVFVATIKNATPS